MTPSEFTVKYPSLLFIDTETTGLDPKEDEIIELGYILYKINPETAKYEQVKAGDWLIQNTKELNPRAIAVNHITQDLLDEEGIDRQDFYKRLTLLMEENKDAVLGAYNTQFDALFIQEELRRATGDDTYTLDCDMLDVLSIYRDRYRYPHKLVYAISNLGVEGTNSHRALDDIKATYEVFRELMKKEYNPHYYINRFGYLAKWGVMGERFQQIFYVAQSFNGTGAVSRVAKTYYSKIEESNR